MKNAPNMIMRRSTGLAARTTWKYEKNYIKTADFKHKDSLYKIALRQTSMKHTVDHNRLDSQSLLDLQNHNVV